MKYSGLLAMWPTVLKYCLSRGMLFALMCCGICLGIPQTTLAQVNSKPDSIAIAPSSFSPVNKDGMHQILVEAKPDQQSINPMPYPKMDFLKRLQYWLKAPSVAQDINPKFFKDFWLKWELVTTRYKIDGQELRFVYVNKIGADALAAGVYPFPEGTVFAKIGAQAIHDPLFDTSLIPGRVNRVQVMLKKANDPKARDGWVYSLYTPGPWAGHLEKGEVDACQACHVVAKDRDMIFSQPFPGPFGASPAHKKYASTLLAGFKATPISGVPSKTHELVTEEVPDVQEVMYLTMPAFSGTLMELREVVSDLARKNAHVYVLSSPDEKSILVARLHQPDTPRHCVDLVDSLMEGRATVPAVRKWAMCSGDER